MNHSHTLRDDHQIDLQRTRNGVIFTLHNGASYKTAIMTAEEAYELGSLLIEASKEMADINQTVMDSLEDIRGDILELSNTIEYLRGLHTPAFPTVRISSKIDAIELKLNKLLEKKTSEALIQNDPDLGRIQRHHKGRK